MLSSKRSLCRVSLGLALAFAIGACGDDDDTFDAAPGFDAPVVTPDAPPAEFDAPPVEFDAPPVEFDAPPVEFDAPPVDIDAAPVTPDAAMATLADVRAAADNTALDLTVPELYVTYVRTAGYYVQNEAAGPAMFVYINPTTQGVAIGNKITLHVTETSTYHGLKEIKTATVLANDAATNDVGALRQSLAAGTGTAPGEDLESELVGLTGATITGGSGQNYTISYGSGPTVANLFAYEASTVGLCIGATFDLPNAVVSEYDGTYQIEAWYAADLANVVTTACAVVDDSNWDFEDFATNPIDDFQYVGGGFTLTQETTLVHNGTSSAKLVWTSTSNQDLITTWHMPAIEGTTYQCGVWAYDDDPAGRIRLGLSFYDATGTRIGTGDWSSTYSADAAAWAQLTHGAAAPATTTYVICTVRMYDDGTPWVAGSSATVYVDDLTITAP